jgi:hypothetical protein
MENQPGITLNDIANAAQVIDIAVSRGAFRAGEAADVGTVYNKLTAFLKASQAQAQASVAEEPAAEAPAAEAPEDSE